MSSDVTVLQPSNYQDFHTLGILETDVLATNLYIHNFTGHHTTADVINALNLLLYRTDITVYIDSLYSEWDQFNEMEKIKNTLFNNPKNFKLSSVLLNCSGPASYLFLCFDKRVVYESSVFNISNKVSSDYGSYHKTKAKMAFDIKMSRLYDKILSNFFSEKELEQLHDGTEFWFDSKEMLERGIATHIQIGPNILTADEYLNSLNVKQTKPSKIVKKTSI